MLFRASIYLTGFGLSVIGGVNIIAYLNLLSMGYNISHYLMYIGRRPECYLLIVGLLLIWCSVYGIKESKE